MRVIVQEDETCEPLWPNNDFTGEWIIEWSSGTLKYKCHYLEGSPYGKCVSFWKNAKIAQEGEYCNGTPIGVWVDYDENGLRFKETVYKSSTDFIEKWIDSSGEVVKTIIFQNGLET